MYFDSKTGLSYCNTRSLRIPYNPPDALGWPSMTRRKIAFYGNCQADALTTVCHRYLAPAQGDLTVWVNSTVTVQDSPEEVERRRYELRDADVIIEQVFDQEKTFDVHSSNSTAPIFYFPQVTGIFLWPFSGRSHPGNAGRWPEVYPAELGDGFLNRMVNNGTPLDEAVESYLALDIAKITHLDRLFELHCE